ncbi:MAG: IS66 family transposase [Proteobacteria bacterium]|nr:IS66 family transposase [Pseudomonadota bacterium]
MVDGIPPDLSKLTDVEAMRAMLEQLVEMVKSSQKSIENLTQTIEQQTQTIEQQTQTIEQQSQTIEHKNDEINQLKKMLFGKKSEKIVPIDREVKKRRKKDESKAKQDREKARQKRKKRAAAKKKLPRENKEHRIPDDECCCPHCGGEKYSFLGWEESVEYEFVPAHFKQIIHRREKKACTCGEHVITAPAPVRVSEGVIYGPGMHAHAVVSKCLDSIPFYRLGKQFDRVGIPLSRSTICDMFHRSAGLLAPIYDRIIELLPMEKYVNADETRIKVQEEEKTREAYMWTFIGGPFVAYAFSPSRSGATPTRILGDSTGILQVDQYSGYNQVTTPDKRERAGCIAHGRRKFFEARDKAPELANYVLEKVIDIYEVEYDAADENILGTEKHLDMRKARSAPLMVELKEHLEKERPNHLPKGPMGKAITYTVDNWKEMTLFLQDAKIRLDNNISEGHLRLIALGRKNYLFVGNDVAGQNLAILQTLVASAVANDKNPQQYLADVLIRTQTHPLSKIDELLPHNWKPPPPTSKSVSTTENQDE